MWCVGPDDIGKGRIVGHENLGMNDITVAPGNLSGHRSASSGPWELDKTLSMVGRISSSISSILVLLNIYSLLSRSLYFFKNIVDLTHGLKALSHFRSLSVHTLIHFGWDKIIANSR